MKTKYAVTDSQGERHTRTSERTYTHVVVARKEGYTKTRASWCGRPDLATKQLASWLKYGWTAEIVKI